ncbi:MAG: ACT domain-containing protein [Desulfobacteraceae bacterium]|nr:ACT domain-containing protein [Desulfobacteraceae bacterium]
MKKFSISVLGQDRPGIIAAVTQVLFEQGFNIEDVSQTILQGEFSSIFIVAGPEKSDPQALVAILNKTTSALNMQFHVRELEGNPPKWTQSACQSFVITTFGPDQKGLVAQVTRVLADFNVNVTQLQAAFRGGDAPGSNYMIYEVDIPNDIDQQKLRDTLKGKCRQLNLDVSIQHKNIFEAVNRV